jgi:antitoxin component YwqK of YwqJK toxin-antitoxin module
MEVYMKKTLIITAALMLLATAAFAVPVITGVQNETGAAFYQGTTKVAGWSFNADGSVDAEGATINGIVKIYFGEGDKRRFVLYSIKGNKIQDGTYSWVYKSGEPAGEETFNNGSREGTFKFLYKTGKTSKEGAYKNGKKEGVIKLYYETGNLAEEGFYKDGLKDGEFTLCYPGGEPKERFTYVNDRRHGVYQQFYRSGTIKMEGLYKLNLKEGKFFKYFESGEDAGIQDYNKGVLVSGENDPEADFEVTTPLE